MRKHSVALAAFFAAPGALAAPFQVLSLEAGGGISGIGGPGFTTSFGTFFNAAPAIPSQYGLGAIAPADSYTALNAEEFDSYFTIDGFGPSARNRTTRPADNSITTMLAYGGYGPAGGASANYDVGEFNPSGSYIYGPGGHIGDDPFSPGSQPANMARGIGVAFSPPPVPSGHAPDGLGGRDPSRDFVFLGRLTVQTGATISGGLVLHLLDPSSPSGFSSGTLLIGGPAVTIGTASGPQLFQLTANLLNAGVLRGSPVNIEVPTYNNPPLGDDGEPLPFGPADVYDLWGGVVPAPGAAVIIGAGGLITARRRRV